MLAAEARCPLARELGRRTSHEVTKLLLHPHLNVRRWAKAMLRRLGDLIDHSRVRDAEMEARIED